MLSFLKQGSALGSQSRGPSQWFSWAGQVDSLEALLAEALPSESKRAMTSPKPEDVLENACLDFMFWWKQTCFAWYKLKTLNMIGLPKFNLLRVDRTDAPSLPHSFPVPLHFLKLKSWQLALNYDQPHLSSKCLASWRETEHCFGIERCAACEGSNGAKTGVVFSNHQIRFGA